MNVYKVVMVDYPSLRELNSSDIYDLITEPGELYKSRSAALARAKEEAESIAEYIDGSQIEFDEQFDSFSISVNDDGEDLVGVMVITCNVE